jgi:Glyoxalase/Bleomycin resistance protein/Dioxygenase superfamily
VTAGERRSALLLGLAFLIPGAFPAADASNDSPAIASTVRFFVVVKSSNYSQKSDGELTLLNFHFFSEVFPAPGSQVHGTLMSRNFDRAKSYEKKNDTLYIEGGHFASLAALDAAYPNDTYRVTIDDQPAEVANGTLDFRGDGGVTDIPEPIHIAIAQEGRSVAPTEIESSKPTTIRWNRFSNGQSDPRGIVDDMIFVVIQDCRGRNVFHTGLPFDGKYLRYEASEVHVPAHLLEAGQPYSMFVEMPHVVDSTRVHGIPGFASFATATYLDLRTLGAPGAECPAALPPMDTGQTDRSGVGAGVGAGAGAGAGGDAGVASGTVHSAKTAEGRLTGQATFLYYQDLTAPRKFYGKVLGLVPYLDTEWVVLFHTVSGSTIGIVKAPHGHVSPSRKRGVVMVSLITDDVAAWYEKLSHDINVHVVKALYDHPGVPIRAFEVEDPAGYPVEFFQWLDPPGSPKQHPN